MEAIVTPQMYPKVRTKLKVADDDATSASARAAMMAGSRADSIVPEPAPAINWKNTQATVFVRLFKRVKSPNPIAERAKDTVWIGR